jgi:heme exporter protein A
MSLVARHLSCIRQDRLIFRDVGFSLEPGAGLWIRGRNGAGKSSLLRQISGLLRPSDGAIHWQGEDIYREPDGYRRSFRYVAHQDALKVSFSARENLAFWVAYHGHGNAGAALRAFELETIADYPVRILSAGQKKRASLARLLASPAPLWILDEPVSSLDSGYVAHFRAMLQEHLAGGGMALLATHQDLDLPELHVLDLDQQRTDT